MPSKAKLVEQAEKKQALNIALSDALKAQANAYGEILGEEILAKGNSSDMFRKAALALVDLQHEDQIGKLSDPAAVYLETIGRSAWYVAHKHLGKAAPVYKRGDNATINMGLMKLTKISITLSLDGYITNEKTNEKWAVKAVIMDLLGKERGFNGAFKFANEVTRRHAYLCENDLEYAQVVGYVPPKDGNPNGRPRNTKASDKTMDLVAEKVRIMDAEQCYASLRNVGSQLVMFVSKDDPSRIDTMARIMAHIKACEADIRAMLAESAAGGRKHVEQPAKLEADANTSTDQLSAKRKPRGKKQAADVEAGQIKAA